MKTKLRPQTVRRSVALPRSLVEELELMASSEPNQNLNRLVTKALKEVVARCRAEKFAKAMAEMAADRSIRKECAVISSEFGVTDSDGLSDD